MINELAVVDQPTSIKLRKSYYNPRKIKRAYQLEYVMGSEYHFKVGSLTKAGHDVEKRRPYIDILKRGVWCTCEDFYYRHAKHQPTLEMQCHWCKHISDSVEILQSDGILDENLQPISEDGEPLHLLDYSGEPLPDTYYLACPRSDKAQQMFVYADPLDVPENMKLLSTEISPDPATAVAVWLEALGINAAPFRVIRQPEMMAWEVRRIE